MDFTYIQENGTLGIIGVLVFIVYKLLGYKFPAINGGGHAKRTADAAEAQLSVTRKTNAMLEKMGVQQNELVEVHTGQFARRENGTPKCHNDPERELEIHQTAQDTKKIHALMTTLNDSLKDVLHERGQDHRMDGIEKKLDTFIKAHQK